jgi:hypothetical protein
MKIKFFILVFFAALLACRPTVQSGELVSVKYPKIKRYLPAPLDNVHFNMPFGQFKEIFKDFAVDNTLSFRSEVVLGFDDPTLKTVTYYFDKEGIEPLYEVIIEYQSEQQRDQVAKKLFKSPNHPEGQWRYRTRDGLEIWAWTFQNKLIIASPLPGTEWANEGE